MQLPFSHNAFLDVFGAYNSLFWPIVVLFWILTAALAWHWLQHKLIAGRAVFALLAAHWAWAGIAYHWLFFREINPAATIFSALFLLQAGLFAWLAARSKAKISTGGLRGIVGAALVLYGLIYPAIGILFGLEYPRLPLFAVPCPTALVTAGFLIANRSAQRVAALIPFLWAVIGSSAAFALGIRADLALIVAATMLALDTLLPSALGSRAEGQSALPGLAANLLPEKNLQDPRNKHDAL